jgi:hypothetical protein
MLIGRMPVNSVAELDAIINKTIAYEQAERQPWQGRLTLSLTIRRMRRFCGAVRECHQLVCAVHPGG